MSLKSYTLKELEAVRQQAELRQKAQDAKLLKLERKAIADSMLESFALTGSTLPADANPSQLHLF